VFIFVLIFSVKSAGRAQSSEVIWNPPINISNTPTSSIYPAIVADKYGFVHVFWAEDLNGKPVDPLEPEEKSNSILYSFWDGYSWSNPIDIFYSSVGSAYNFPFAVIDNAETLHLVWQSYAGIQYSSVPLKEAKFVKSWQPAQVIAQVRGDGPRIYASPRWGLQIIYTAWENAETGSHDGNVYYMHSEDNGRKWSSPIRLSSLVEHENANISHPSLAEGGQNITHALWVKSEPPDWTDQ
jgi:hypothetical protein